MIDIIIYRLSIFDFIAFYSIEAINDSNEASPKTRILFKEVLSSPLLTFPYSVLKEHKMPT